MLTVGGIPAHPLIVHAVVVLLPLAAVGTLAIAGRPVWRRQLGVWVLLLALAGVVAIPLAVRTGQQLQYAIGNDAAIEVHAQRAETLLVPALIFLLLLAATVVVGRRADTAARVGGLGSAHALAGNTATLQRVTLIVGVLAAIAGLGVTGLVVWIGHAGSTAAWSGVGT